VVVQSDEFNRSRIATIMAVVLTSNVRLAEAPGNVLLKRRETGLPRDSVANVSHVITLDRSFFVARVKSLSTASLHDVESGLQLVLSL
jgi:mRNA interferase MazF